MAVFSTDGETNNFNKEQLFNKTDTYFENGLKNQEKLYV